MNLTNHSYFNLNGKGKINGHLLQVKADHYTLNGRDGIPTGEVVSVEGSAMDFRTPKTIGRDAGKSLVSAFSRLRLQLCYQRTSLCHRSGDNTGITLIADTDRPGVQLYTANALTLRKGKRAGFTASAAACLETQNYPDAIHYPEWPSCILKAGETWRSFTTYTFR